MFRSSIFYRDDVYAILKSKRKRRGDDAHHVDLGLRLLFKKELEGEPVDDGAVKQGEGCDVYVNRVTAND